MSPWKETTLRDEIELAYGKSLPAHSRRPGPIGVFGSNGLVGTHDEPLVEGPGIVVGRKGSVGVVTFCAAAFWPIDTTYFVVNKGGHNWRYLYYRLLSSGLTELNSHSTVPGLNREDVYSLALTMPPREAQDEVARVLDCIDNSINVESNGLAHAQVIRRAAMQQLFGRGLNGESLKESELGPVPASWGVLPLGELCTLSTGTTPSTNDPSYYRGDIPFVKTADVVNNRILTANTFISDQAMRDYSLKLYPPGTVLMAMYGQGKTRGQVSLLEISATTTQNAAAIQSSAEVHPPFLWHYLMSQYERLRGMGSLGHVSHLNLGYLRHLPVVLPPLGEQEEIAVILDALDQKVELHLQKRSRLQAIFSALLRRLMTGALRTSDLDTSVLTGIPTIGEPAA